MIRPSIARDLLLLTLCLLPASVMAAVPTVYGKPFTNRYLDTSSSGPHLVFAHLQMSAGDYGKHFYGQAPSVADYVKDIQEAKACGVDGFAANIDGWSVPYQEAWGNLLQAADQVNAENGGASNSEGVRDFYIFAQPDFSTFPQNTATIVALVNAGVTHACYYKHAGRPWLGTYAGEGGTYAQVKDRFSAVKAALLAQSPPVRIYFCPFFNIRDPDGTGPKEEPHTANAQEVDGLLTGLANAAWLYGTGTGPPVGTDTGVMQAERYSHRLHKAGLAWMGTVTPQYIGFAHRAPGRFYCEAYGGETLAYQWRSIIGSQGAAWVQLVTWNDDDEGSNFTNADFGPGSPWPYLAHSSVPGYYKSKLGLQALNLYYIQWYKTGVPPKIAKDAVFAFYRTQPAEAKAANDPRGAIGPFYTGTSANTVPDTFFLATMARAKSTLTVVNGGQTTTRLVPPGLSFSRVPFVPGPASFRLSRSGREWVALTGEPVESRFDVYDWNYYTAWAHD